MSERCEYNSPLELRIGERITHFAAEPENGIQKCFRCGKVLSDEGDGMWATGSSVEERQANHYVEWTLVSTRNPAARPN